MWPASCGCSRAALSRQWRAQVLFAQKSATCLLQQAAGRSNFSWAMLANDFTFICRASYQPIPDSEGYSLSCFVCTQHVMVREGR
jgi:hypothetical protein